MKPNLSRPRCKKVFFLVLLRLGRDQAPKVSEASSVSASGALLAKSGLCG